MAKKKEMEIKGGNYTSANTSTTARSSSYVITTGILNPESNFYTITPADVSPEKDCDICKGKGLMRCPEDPSSFQSCDCVEKKKILRYLTNTYSGAKTIPVASFNTEAYKNRNLLLQNIAQPIYLSIVKSFLLYTLYKHSHLTVSGYDILDAYYKQFEQDALMPLLNADYLFITLCIDPINKQYAANLPSLFEKRKSLGKFTWIYTNKEIQSEPFKRIYSHELACYILENFHAPGENK